MTTGEKIKEILTTLAPFLILIAIIVGLIIGCIAIRKKSNKVVEEYNDLVNEAQVEYLGNHFEYISGSKTLYYSKDTKVIYIVMSKSDYVVPYIDKNGKPCIYEDGEIKESEVKE